MAPGESFAGKTTLTAALVQAAAIYYSDEYAVLDPNGRAHPYARPPLIRNADGSSTERPVTEFGDIAAGESAGLALVSMTRYRAGAGWQPVRLSTGEGVLAMLANTFPRRSARGTRCGCSLGRWPEQPC